MRLFRSARGVATERSVAVVAGQLPGRRDARAWREPGGPLSHLEQTQAAADDVSAVVGSAVVRNVADQAQPDRVHSSPDFRQGGQQRRFAGRGFLADSSAVFAFEPVGRCVVDLND